MKIDRSEILGPKRYEPIRDDYRRRTIEKKKARRVLVGDRVSLVFENRDTLLFQIEEMLRAESISDEKGIQGELDVYNSLMPSPTELSATLFLEVPTGEEGKRQLHELIGLDEHLSLHIGPHQVRAWFEPGRQEGERISAVQYTRYRLPADAALALRTPGTKLALEIDHPNYRHRVELSEATRASLADDLQ